MRAFLADLILILHFAFVGFVVAGLALTWLGAAAHWQWVRNFRFRLGHLLAVAFVAIESAAGVMCPLTAWEDALRGRDSDLGFIARWVHRIMFYEFPGWVFTVVYLAFAGVVAITWWLVPPKRSRRRTSHASLT